MKFLIVLLFSLVVVAGCTQVIPQIQEEPVSSIDCCEEPEMDVSDVLSDTLEVPLVDEETVGELLPEPIELDEEDDQEESSVHQAIIENLRFVDYIVEIGDTLSGISYQFGVSINQIMDWNGLEDAGSIYTGQTLSIGQDISVFLEEQSEVVSATIDYLLYGQDEKPESERLNWNEGFLHNLDLTALHQQFVDGGADPEDMENFALFLTHNAPILENWEQEFRLQAFTRYQVQISRIESIGGDDFQTYRLENGDEVPFAIVSARTGHYIR